MRPSTRQLIVPLGVGTLTLLALPVLAGGTLKTWLGGDGSSFHLARNWDPIGVPTALDDVLFAESGAYSVLFDAAASSATIVVDDGEGTFELAANSFATGELIVGDDPLEPTVLTLDGGTLSCDTARVGKDPAAEGDLVISGDSVATFDSELVAGDAGAGEVHIAGGATSATAIVGDDPTALGTVIVDGGGTWMNPGNMTVGNFGIGTAEIVDGGTATWGGLTRIGDELGANGTVLVDGGTSMLTINAETFVGNQAIGAIDVQGGATLNTTRVKLGDEPGSTGTVVVDGLGSTWSDSVTIFVGNFGSGSLTVSNGAAVNGVEGVLGDDPGSDGTVLVTGTDSSWTSTSTLAVGDLGQGDLTVNDGAAVTAPLITVNAQSAIGGDGMINGDVINTGRVRPGDPLGALAINGTFTQGPAGRLEIDLSALGGDVLNVSGTAQLDGTLDLSFMAGSEPAGGQEFTVLTAGSRTGTFDTVVAPRGVTVTYAADAVMVTVDGVGCPWDITGDGSIGPADLAALLDGWGPNPGHPADFNGDDVVGPADLAQLLDQWGVCP